MNGSSAIDDVIMHGLRDLAAVDRENPHQVLRLNPAESQNVSTVFFSIPHETGRCINLYYYHYYHYWMASLRRSSANVKEGPNCAACSVAYTFSCPHHTDTQSAPLVAAEVRIPRKCMPLSQRHHLHPPLVRISLTSYTRNSFLDHSTPVPTPASRKPHHAGAR